MIIFAALLSCLASPQFVHRHLKLEEAKQTLCKVAAPSNSKDGIYVNTNNLIYELLKVTSGSMVYEYRPKSGNNAIWNATVVST